MVRYSCYQSIIVHIGERWMADSCTPISFHRDSVIRREMKRSNDKLTRFIAFQYFPLKSYHYNEVSLNKNNQKSRQSKIIIIMQTILNSRALLRIKTFLRLNNCQ